MRTIIARPAGDSEGLRGEFLRFLDLAASKGWTELEVSFGYAWSRELSEAGPTCQRMSPKELAATVAAAEAASLGRVGQDDLAVGRGHRRARRISRPHRLALLRGAALFPYHRILLWDRDRSPTAGLDARMDREMREKGLAPLLSYGYTCFVLKSAVARSIALFAGIHLLGGHWLVLQMVAWIGMFAVNSQEVPLGEALGKTFGGKHPCAVCHAVESGQERERDEILIDSATKVNAVLLSEVRLPARVGKVMVYFSVPAFGTSREDAPHSRPPWGA